MKKRIFATVASLVYFLSLSLFPVLDKPQRAQADAEGYPATYACICTSDAYFYATRDTRRGLFLLPETYFVKVLSAEPEVCRVEYLYDSEYTQKLVGYAKTEDLTFVDFTPQTPYLFQLIDLHYTIDDGFSVGEGFLNQLTVTCAYYGDFLVGSQPYCYVLRDGVFGYVPQPEDFTPLRSSEYADYLAQTATPPPTSDENPATDGDTQSGMSGAQIALLVVLCLLVPVLAALILKPTKRPSYEPDE